MEASAVAVVAGVVGLVLGAGLVLLLRRSPARPSSATDGATAPAQVADRPARGSSPRPARLGSGATDVLDALHGATVVVDRDDAVVRASPMAHLIGLVRGDQVRVEEIAAAVRTVRIRGDHRSMEVEIDRGRTGGGVRSLAIQVVPLGDQMVLVTAEDVTESRRLDAVRRDFVANVSHELKTPVGALSLLAEAVADASDDPEAIRRFTGRMQHESARLTELVNELIELSRLQDTGHPMDLEDLAVDAILDEAVDATRTVAAAKQITIERGPASGLHLQGDRIQLVTALRNLLGNAVSYSPDSTRIGVAARKGEDGLLEISVSDQGIGIPVADQERIFERFYRVDPARSRMTGGTGLGLSIVKHVAARHGGEVTLWSVEGSGSTFTLRLPWEATA
jgi:two-component system, OmpR family, sensor histidine kinase SenX3